MQLDWQKLYKGRKEIADNFGEIWDLPVASRYHRVVAKEGGAGTRLLEVGAGDRSFERKIAGYWGAVTYRSCDIDPTYQHDFGDIRDVEGLFDVIVAFEMIEHLTLSDAHGMVTRMYELLEAGGRVALTTPNIYYPPAFLRDATHVTPFCYDELGSLLTLAGFRVKSIHRLHHDSLIKKFVRRVLFYPLFRILGIDFARQIIIVAEKPPS